MLYKTYIIAAASATALFITGCEKNGKKDEDEASNQKSGERDGEDADEGGGDNRDSSIKSRDADGNRKSDTQIQREKEERARKREEERAAKRADQKKIADDKKQKDHVKELFETLLVRNVWKNKLQLSPATLSASEDGATMIIEGDKTTEFILYEKHEGTNLEWMIHSALNIF